MNLKRKSKINNLIFLTFILSNFLCFADSTNYQYYIPVENKKVDRFIQKGLEALKEYGDFKIPINELHIRRSKLVENPRLFSRADIQDWQTVKTRINDLLNSHKSLRSHFNYSTVKSDTLRQKVLVIKLLNSILLDEDFYSEEKFPNLKLTDEQEKWAGEGFFGSFSKDTFKLNRSLLDVLLKGAMASFKVIKRPKINMQLCELASEKRGVFVIYLKHEPDSDPFYCELAHEMFHLLNPKIYDWHMEGLASVFAENLLKKERKSWEHFKKVLSNTQKAYGASYHFVKTLHQHSDTALKSMIMFTKPWRGPREKIDIKPWLKGTSSDFQKIYKQNLSKYYPILIENKSNNIEFN
ncbi:MAG: hypothetical protein NE330_08045 [Lentisphaeraceae bacterium]|nr:hypothetical protein [Lentisphaeraceae bacterium]